MSLFDEAETVGFSLWPRKSIDVILQMEASECGLACLAMLAHYHGSKQPLSALRERYPTSRRGTTMLDLSRMADGMGLSATCLEVTASEVRGCAMPLIAHWAGNHWVVIEKISSKGWLINDPASGKAWISHAQGAAKFSAYILEISRAAHFERAAPQARFQFAKLLKSLPNFAWGAAQLLVISIVLELLSLLMPYYTQIVIDHVLVNNDKELLMVLALAASAIVIFQAIFSAARGWLSAMVSNKMSYQLHSGVIKHLFKLPVDYFSRRQAGDILSRFESLAQLSNALTRTSVDIVLDVFISACTLALMFMYSSLLALISVAFFVFTSCIKYYVFYSSNTIVAERTFLNAKRSTHLIESLYALHAIKIACAEYRRTAQWLELAYKIMQKDVAVERINILSALTFTATSGLLHVLVIFIAASLIFESKFSLGVMFAFIAYQATFSARSAALIDKVLWLRTMKVHFGQVSDIIFSRPESYTLAPLHGVSSGAAQLQLNNVGFRYAVNDPLVLQSVSLEVLPSQMVAIVGPSGCGKSTLLSVVAGIFPPTHGHIVLNQTVMHAGNVVDLRKNLAFVFQNDALFEGTILENITFFDDTQDLLHVADCLCLACIDAEIALMPAGIHTRLGEQGSGISGGQRQRLLIARALYKKPNLLLLDEATSALDVATEKKVLENLKQAQITVVMSAHRPDAIAISHRVYSLVEKIWVG